MKLELTLAVPTHPVVCDESGTTLTHQLTNIGVSLSHLTRGWGLTKEEVIEKLLFEALEKDHAENIVNGKYRRPKWATNLRRAKQRKARKLS